MKSACARLHGIKAFHTDLTDWRMRKNRRLGGLAYRKKAKRSGSQEDEKQRQLEKENNTSDLT